MVLLSLRPALKRAHLRARTSYSRPASSASNAVSTAKDQAATVASKAQAGTAAAKDQASRVIGAVQERATQAVGAVQNLAGSAGNRITGLLGGYREPVVYNLSVAKELLKQVYVAERLAPPTSFSAITEAYTTLFNRARDFNYWKELARSGNWAKVGVYALEAYGIFKIGEIVGRRSVVGYTLN